MQNYILVLKGIVNYIIVLVIVFIVHIVLRIKYKLTNDYKLKRYFQSIALNCNNSINDDCMYYKYCLRNGLIQKSKNGLILTEKGLEFLKLIYNENNNYLIAFFSFVSLVISITAFAISVSDILIKIIENIK